MVRGGVLSEGAGGVGMSGRIRITGGTHHTTMSVALLI